MFGLGRKQEQQPEWEPTLDLPFDYDEVEEEAKFRQSISRVMEPDEVEQFMESQQRMKQRIAELREV